MTTVLALMIVTPVLAAAACLAAWRIPHVQRGMALVASLAVLALAIALHLGVAEAGPVDLLVGNWPMGMAIRLRADPFATVMVLVVAVLALCVLMFATVELPEPYVSFGAPPLVLILVMGVCGAFLTADLFNLYVWLEVLLLASFVLLALGGARAQLRGGTVYVVLNIISSALLLTGIALVYAAVSALDFDVIRSRLATLAVDRPSLVVTIEVMLLVGFGIKAAVFPLFFWLPISYPTPAPSFTALFAVLAGVGVYAMMRIVVGVFPYAPAVYAALVWVAALTMVVGTAAAVVQARLRAVISFLDVGHVGYVVAGLAIAGGAAATSRDALAGAIYYLVHHVVVTADLFLIAGVIRRLRGREDLVGLGGLAHREPVLAGAFVIGGFSVAGIPPLSGFWAKLGILAPALARGHWWLAAAAVLAGILTLVAFARIWNAAFSGKPPGDPGPELTLGQRVLLYTPVVLLSAATLLLGVFAGDAFAIAGAAASWLAGVAP